MQTPNTVRIVEPDASWSGEFASLSRQLRDAIGALALRIDHIGSTAVPALAAKDCIDVQISVSGESDFQLVSQRLKSSGFEHVSHVSADHVPPFGPDDPAEWTKILFRQAPGARRANIHVRVTGRANQRYALLFRDYLKEHPEAARAYETFKRNLSVHFENDPGTYSDLKDPVCDLIMISALTWARSTGWACD